MDFYRQIFREFSILRTTHGFIKAFTRTRHGFLSLERSVQSKYFHCVSLRFIVTLDLSFHLRLRHSSWYLALKISPDISILLLFCSVAFYINPFNFSLRMFHFQNKSLFIQNITKKYQLGKKWQTFSCIETKVARQFQLPLLQLPQRTFEKFVTPDERLVGL